MSEINKKLPDWLFNFDDFKTWTSLEIKSLGVICPRCKSSWGIKIFHSEQYQNTQHSIADVNPKRFVCEACLEKDRLEPNNVKSIEK